MTTEQKFDCIFCKDVFDNKEELQVHFRKHADPKFKSKNRFEVDSEVSNEKSKEKADMVSCDVCSQMFPTISKAITHKHKVHPDHDLKYFCPWCGKLFTMKHPYNIHIQTSHDKQEQIENKIFHCDCCDVDFFLPSAMMYHNKFFHRQDTDIPEVGTSKKLKLYNQEVLQLYYCAFCGEEYENKVNLFKHITDDHGDENQCPEEVLRCPLCEAIFYHLDAYEIHLTFHTTEDLYSANNELFADLLDFSLETVPPVIEKVENREDFDIEAHSQEDTDMESSVNAVGIEKFLELAMDQTEDSNPSKVKKKKHKKSKKSAITLDEFLSMNQDVFGEGLDFQGVEEVPTRVVAKKLKTNKKATNAAASAELEKLKQKGIVVMKVAASKPTKIAQKRVVNKPTPNRELKTSSEVLTKLMNQSNSQIKIVKKSIPNVNKNDTEQVTQNAATEATKTSAAIENENLMNENKDDEDKQNNKEIESADNKTETADNKTESADNKAESSPSEDTSENLTSHKTEDDIVSMAVPAKSVNNSETPLGDENKPEESNTNNDEHDTSKISVADDSQIGTENIDNVQTSVMSNDEKANEHNSDEEIDSDEIIKNNVTNTEKSKESEDVDQIQASDKNTSQPNVSPVVNSLSTLKHLSHLTVKPVNQNKNISSPDNSPGIKNDQKPQIKNGGESPRPIVSTDNVCSDIPVKPVVEKDPTLDALKNLCKNITIKSLSTSTKRNIEESESDDGHEADTGKQTLTTRKIEDVTANKNLTIKKIKIEKNEPANASKVITAVANAIKNTKNPNKTAPSEETKTSIMSTDTQDSTMINNANILKHLPNITTKPSNIEKIQTLETKQTSASVQSPERTHKEGEIIEISDFDDSEDETPSQNAEHNKQDAPKSLDPLKNLSKHITVKSLNKPAQSPQRTIKVESNQSAQTLKKHLKVEVTQPAQSLQKNIQFEKAEENDDEGHDYVFNSIDDMPPNTKMCSQKLSSRNIAFKNALKNLSKNITVKSRTSSPSQSIKAQEHNSEDSNVAFNEEASDSDTEIGKVKITEIKDNESNHSENFEEFDDFDDEQSPTKPIVQSPHSSCSDNDEIPEKDFEENIRASTMQKSRHEITTNKNTICLNNLKNISSSITVKSLSSNYTEKQDNTKLSQPQEGATTPTTTATATKNQAKSSVVKQVQSANESAAKSRNLKRVGKIIDHTSNESLNQNVSVNKEVTVKTFQTKTVIQEITTTVTKTIKTVNQTVNQQEVRKSNQMNIPVLPQRVQGMKASSSKNLQGVVIRHAAPAPARPSNAVTQVRPAATQVRPAAPAVRASKQIVPVRPGLNVARPSTPRMPSAKPNLPKSSPKKEVMGKPLKFSPSVLASTVPKRPNPEGLTGPFSCFKKPKESLIPESEITSLSGISGESVVQVNAASHTSTSNYMSMSKVVKGNSVVTATQMKSEVTSMQQLSRLSNTVGIKAKSSQVKQTQVQEKSDSSCMKRTTLAAIEKLQKQGLLVKKPRVEGNETSGSENVDDNVDYNSTDEHDE